MQKTTVYLTDEEIEGLRRLAASTGRSQSELIRAGVRHVIEEAPPRRFHSLGTGEGSGERRPRWPSDELYEKALGRHPVGASDHP